MSFEPGLYVHIPFCIKKCDYCDFFSVQCSGIPHDYVEAVVNHTLYLVKKYNITGWKTIYFGGGTPGLLTPSQINTLFLGICGSTNNVCQEITFEMNPETVTKEKLECLEKLGCTRISLGIQSFNDSALAAVGRHCTSKKCIEGVDLIKKYWKKDFNLDSIAGLPGQSSKEALESLQKVIDYNPQHISYYSLMIEEGTPLFDKVEKGLVIERDECDSEWLAGRELLFKNGYSQYEVSNFSKTGHESIHNKLYWQQKNYGGVGSGGTGTFYSYKDGSFSGERWTNTQDIKKYTDFWKNYDFSLLNCNIPGDLYEEYEELDIETLEFEYLMMGLRTSEGVSQNNYSKRFSSLEWNGMLSKRLNSPEVNWDNLCKEGKAFIKEKDGDLYYGLTPEGLLFLNSVLINL